MLFANEEKGTPEEVLRDLSGNCIVGKCIDTGYFGGHEFTDIWKHSLRRSRYMFVTIFKLTTFIILNTSCEQQNWQILRGAARIS